MTGDLVYLKPGIGGDMMGRSLDIAELKNRYAGIGFVEAGTKKFEHLHFEAAFKKFDIDIF